MPRYEPLEVGHIVAGRYEILDTLGAGGFSAVYKARQLNTGKLVAVKLLLPERLDDEDSQHAEIARFEREMRIIAGIKHPHIVPLIDSGRTDEEQLFLVLEFIEGETLAGLLHRQRRLPARDACRLMVQALDALAAAHELGVVHRDFKPHNIMLTSSGMLRHAMVLDFGVAGVMEDCRAEDYEQLTGEGQVPGTPAYMAPEQIRTDVLDPRIDIYAWGLVLLECLTGRKAVSAGSLAKTIAQQLSPVPVPVPPPLRDHPLGQILRQATAKDPALRYARAAEILLALDELVLDEAFEKAMDAAFGAPRWGSPGGHATAGDSGEEPSVVSALVADESNAVTRAGHSGERPAADAAEASGVAASGALASGPQFGTQMDRRTRSGDLAAVSDELDSAGSSTPLKGTPRRKSARLLGVLVVVVLLAGAGALVVLGSGSGTEVAKDPPAINPASAEPSPTPPETRPPEPETAPQDTDPTIATAADPALPADPTTLPTVEDGAVEAEPLSALSSEMLETRCEAEGGPACPALAERLATAPEEDTAALARAARILETACVAEDPHACAGYGFLFETGHGLKRSVERAHVLYGPACEADVALACRQLGLRQDAGKPTLAERRIAHAHFEKACNLDDAAACKELGSYLERGRVGKADPVRATALYEKACGLGDGHGCSRWGSMLEEGKGVVRDDFGAVRALERACDLGYAHGCSKLAYKLNHGKGVAPRPQEAVELYARACVMGHIDSCSDGCWLINNGPGIAADPDRADALCTKACEAGVRRACPR